MIRRARAEDAVALSELAVRSKAHWGYDPGFMAIFTAQLTLSPEEVAAEATYVLEEKGLMVGFYRLNGSPPDGHLEDLWVDPAYIGHGWGGRLWQDALLRARELGFESITLEADPNAEGFYLSRGAERVGGQPSLVDPQRTLPVMRYLL